MEEWKEYKLGDILNFRRGHDLPKTSMNGGNIPVAGSNGIIGYHDTATPISPCITIGRSGNVGTPYIYDKCWAHNTVLYIDDYKGNYPLYLYYLLKTLPLASFGGGSAVPTLNRNHIHPLLIKHTPNYKTQQNIASILKSLDDKIEVNRKINENLEQQAQALFKSWFVDFEPFKNGEFVESELGMIPKGWRVGSLSEIADINPSRALKKGDAATYLDMKNMPTSGPFPMCCESKVYTGGMRFQNKDTLMARITPCLENGKVAYVNFLEDKEIAFGSTEYIVMTSKNGFFPELLYFLCRDEDFKGYATKNMNGSSGRQRVSGETIGNYKIAIPPKALIESIASFYKGIMDNIKNNGFESRRLAELRDTLLPKLMSGELKVNEIA